LGRFSTISAFCTILYGKSPNFGSPKLSRAGFYGLPDGQSSPFLVFLEDFNKIYNSLEGIFDILIFLVFMTIFLPKNGPFFENAKKFWPKMAIKSQKIKKSKIPAIEL
jgi:hypothetical protein